jgi:IS30 family transposase
LAGKRLISQRPAGAENRSRLGHLEADTVLGSSDKHCVLTLVDRRTGYVMIGKLEARNAETTNERAISLIRGTRRRVRTITVDNGTEFHSYDKIEAATGARFYFATPHHAWERGTCEKHQRPDPSVSAEAGQHATRLSIRLLAHCAPAQRPTP